MFKNLRQEIIIKNALSVHIVKTLINMQIGRYLKQTLNKKNYIYSNIIVKYKKITLYYFQFLSVVYLDISNNPLCTS